LSLERAERLAFAGRFDAAEGAIPRDEAGSPRARWLGAYLDTARGRFARAERRARSILGDASADRDARCLAAITLGSVLRQTGRHAEAREIEVSWLRRAAVRELRAHLLIGLAADAVGLGELRSVDRALGRLGARPAGGWRAAVRARWVRCERELLAGRPDRAAPHARRALAISERARARRHVAKSHLFLGVALRGAGRYREADAAFRRASDLARKLDARPVASVADALLSGSGERR
jgi:tetratricopeptide (TPR) repeat protein